MAPSTATPAILNGPGFLFWAPLGSTLPTNTVAGSVFTDPWPVAWISLGATTDGTTFSYQTSLGAIEVAEFLDPIKWATTGRTGKVTFNLANYTLANYQRALNGGSLAVTSGTGATLLSTYTPPVPGQEVRSMIGWESTDSTERWVAFQTISGAAVNSDYKKAPAFASIPCEFNMEIPASGQPFQKWTAGVLRAGA